MKNIVITGGIGYIGTELCKIYSGESWNNKVTVIDNRFISERVNQLRKWNINFIHADIRDPDLVKDYLKEADIVLLEKQPSFNPKMRNISTALYVYFILRIQYEMGKNCKVIFYPAKYKLKCCDTKIEHKSKDKYRQNKNLGIVHTRELLNSHQDFFEKHKKKDDLADCYLQAMSYIKFFMYSNVQNTLA